MRKLEDWIEYMEDDIDLLSRAKLELLLKHSPEDQIVHENLCRLRREIEKADPALEIEPVLENTQFINSFYSKVMKGVAQIEKDRRRKKREVRSRARTSSQATCKS